MACGGGDEEQRCEGYPVLVYLVCYCLELGEEQAGGSSGQEKEAATGGCRVRLIDIANIFIIAQMATTLKNCQVEEKPNASLGLQTKHRIFHDFPIF